MNGHERELLRSNVHIEFGNSSQFLSDIGQHNVIRVIGKVLTIHDPGYQSHVFVK